MRFNLKPESRVNVRTQTIRVIKKMIRTVSKCFQAANFLERACARCFSGNPNFTKSNYQIQRGNYKTLDDGHITYFTDLLGENRVIMNLSDLEKYNVDWLKQLRGNSRIVLKPETTAEVSKILKFCNEQRLAVCPQGGNTSIVGGGIPVLDEIIISTELMNDIINLDELSGVLVCQAGCVLQTLEGKLAEKNLAIPLDLGAKGSCHIGGNVSTNAGGLRLLRYGSMHANILGLEVVTANGEILDMLSTLKKDNTGYHLKHLFIGSEGTLGFVTKVALQCSSKPRSINLAFLGLQNYAKVLKTFRQARRDLAEILSAIEVMDNHTMELVGEHLCLRSPIGEYPYYLMIETSGSKAEHDQEKLNAFLDLSLVKHFVLNGTVVSEPSKVKAVWEVRERIAETFRSEGYIFCYDFTLPLECYYTLVNEIREHMGTRAKRVFGFGHLGDGNIHLQVSVEKFSSEIKDHLEPYIYNRVKALNGSISSEHGIGFLKVKYINKLKDAHTLKLMTDLKEIMDPNGILNPYKTIPVQKC